MAGPTSTSTTTNKKESSSSSNNNKSPSDAELKVMIRKLIPKVNLQKTGIKAFIKLLSKECGGTELKHRADYIKKELSEAINEMEDSESEGEEDAEEEEGGSDSETEDEPEEPQPKKKRAAGKGLSIKKQISEDLANFLGQGKEMARTDIVKALWDYIKQHDLQNPDNKREILLDDKMKAVFGCERFTMFTMNKYVAAHIHPFKPVDLTPKEPKPKGGAAAGAVGATKKRKRKGAETAAAAAAAKKKRKPKKPGLQPPYKLSKEMAAVVGKDILPRPQVVTALWEYIKKNDLQNPTDKRQIICDDKLKAIMGGNETVTMFNMNRYITDHLLEKLDRSAYVHEEEVEAEPVEDDDDDDANEEDGEDDAEVEEDLEPDVEDDDDEV